MQGISARLRYITTSTVRMGNLPEPQDSSLAVERLDACQQQIGYVFEEPSMLRTALTHASGAEHRLASNERLEFLGDAILGVVVCETLFHMFPTLQEGDLTKIKSVVVSRQTCAKISLALRLDEYLILGKGMMTGHPIPTSVLADVFEAVVAAVFLDGGNRPAREFIGRCVAPEIDQIVASRGGDNFKSTLQQLAQRELSTTPTYSVVKEKGPDHSKHFKVVAELGNRQFDPAWGRNKKEAEQRAARNALSELKREPPPFPSN